MWKQIAFILLASLVTLSCERRTKVSLRGDSRPIFELSGSGRLGEVIIFGPEQERIARSDPFDTTYALWDLKPEKEGEAGAAFLEDLHSITYGVVPRGYVQVKPKSGLPQPLTPGNRYRYWFVTVNAPSASGYFELIDEKPVAVDGP